MSKPPKSQPALPDRSLDYLLDALAAPVRASVHAHRRCADLLAMTIRPCQRATDHIPDERVPFDAFRLFALTSRWCENPRGEVGRKVVLAAYRPEIDLPGSGRIRFACEAAWSIGGRPSHASPDPRRNVTAARTAAILYQAVEDADRHELISALNLPAFFYAFHPERPPVLEPTIVPEAWAAHRVRIGDLVAWPAEFFARPAGRRWDRHPVRDTPCPTPEGNDVTTSDFDGSWALRDGLVQPAAQVPAGVFADLTGLRGRVVRNPAWGTLVRHGIIPQGGTYRQWLAQLGALGSRRRGVPDPRDEATPTGRLRADLERHALADPAHLRRLLDDLLAACAAVGVPVPADPEAAEDALVELLLNPWERAEVPNTAAIQVVPVAGAPAPETAVFAGETVRVDLFDLGPYAGRYVPVPAPRVAEFLARRTDRVRRPAWMRPISG